MFAIGAGDDVVGVTFECDYPPAARSRRVVSTSALPEGLRPEQIDAVVKQRIAAGEDLYHLDEGALAGLSPELVLTQDLCEVCAVDVATVDDAMAHLGCDGRVVTVDPMSLDEVLVSIETVGAAVGRVGAARELVAGLRSRLAAVASVVAGRPRPRVAVIEWTEPPFDAGHWVPDLVDAAGGASVLGTPAGRSSQVTWEAVRAAAPDVVVVSPCGYRLAGAAELARDLLGRGELPEGAAVWAIDADAVMVRPGPRLVDGVEALAGLLHPTCATSPPGSVQRLR